MHQSGAFSILCRRRSTFREMANTKAAIVSSLLKKRFSLSEALEVANVSAHLSCHQEVKAFCHAQLPYSVNAHCCPACVPNTAGTLNRFTLVRHIRKNFQFSFFLNKFSLFLSVTNSDSC